MAKVLLIITFRTAQQFAGEDEDAQKSAVKQLIDAANAGLLVQEDGHSECFTYSVECDLPLGADGASNMSMINGALARLGANIKERVPQTVLIASAGTLVASQNRLEFGEELIPTVPRDPSPVCACDHGLPLQLATEILTRLSDLILSPDSKLRGYDEVLIGAGEEARLLVAQINKAGE